ncbi:LysR family transcriptional regulator [Nocardia sp. NPDC057272]|uniref:LysR family transcriptional regulator n=1 Tax=Nocardia sp. NPDC057272 TaxID=3346079 RepID=UPI003631380F
MNATDERQNQLDLRLVRYAVTLAEELHFGHAAARLVIAQQTLSAQIGELEHRLGVTLFVRDRRSVALTAAGTVFVAGGRRLLADAADLVRQTRGTTRPVRLDVITEGLTSALVAHKLRARLPEMAIEIVQSQGLTEGLRQLRDGALDVTFGRVQGASAIFRDLSHFLVRLDPIGIVLPADHELARLDQVAVLDLASTPLLVHTAVQAEDWADWIDQFIARFGLVVGRRLRGQGRGAVNAAVLTYGMPALGPLTAVPPPGLVVRPLNEPVPLCPVSVVWADERKTRTGELAGNTEILLRALDEFAESQNWRRTPEQSWWLPDGDLLTLAKVLREEDLPRA